MYTLNQYIWVEPQKLPETFLLYLGGRGDATLFVLAMHHIAIGVGHHFLFL